MPLKTKNISDKAYLHIRESLLNSGVYVGQKVPHHELGQKLGISHTPLREALFRLAAEGLLVHQNNRGFSVPAITLEEAREIYEAREVIEPYLAERVAQLITATKIKSFSKILDTYQQLISDPYNRQRILTDKKFHMEIAGLAGNKTLAQMLNQMYDKLIFKSPVEQISTERVKEAIIEHSEILKKFEAKDGKGAAELMRNHIRKQSDYVLSNIIKRKNNEALHLLRPLK